MAKFHARPSFQYRYEHHDQFWVSVIAPSAPLLVAQTGTRWR